MLRASGCMRSLSKTKTLDGGTVCPALIAAALNDSSSIHLAKAVLCAAGQTCSMFVTLKECNGLRNFCSPSRMHGQAEGVLDGAKPV